MENSAYQSLIMGIYTFIFIAATSITVYLYTNTYQYADKAYDYSNRVSKDAVILNTSVETDRILTGSEVITYCYNYIIKDKGISPNLNIEIWKSNKIDTINSSIKMKTLIDTIDINKNYKLQYISLAGTTPFIKITQI